MTGCKVTAHLLQRHCKPVAVALQSSCSITANRYAVTLQTVCSGTAKSMHSLCSEKSLLFTLLQYEYNEALSPSFRPAVYRLQKKDTNTGTLISINIPWNIAIGITSFPEYWVMDLTNKNDSSVFRKIMESKGIYEFTSQIVGVINYDLIFRRSYIAHITDFTLMLDESSLICNENAKRSKFILKLHPESVILLSGTPTAGKYERLWSQLRLLGWDITKKAFYASYVQTEWVEQGDFKREVITGYKHVEHLKKRLAQFGAVFMKTEEVIELPEQTEQKIFLNVTNEYKFFIKHDYLELDTKNLVRFKDDSDYYGEDITPMVELIGDNSLTKTLYCRQLCGQWHKSKQDAFRDLLESTEDRVIVFYNFNEELSRLTKICDALERPYCAVNGQCRDLRAYC